LQLTLVEGSNLKGGVRLLPIVAMTTFQPDSIYSGVYDIFAGKQAALEQKIAEIEAQIPDVLELDKNLNSVTIK